ncbi:MAG: hypothetical protein V3W20_11035 [Candidatus Neomarinimicrobiota bacterium]
MKQLCYCIIFCTFLFLIKCSTPYQPKGLLGGYYDTHLNGNLYKVSFWGNQHTNPEDVGKYILYRCAELSQEKGCDYFIIINKERESNRQQVKVGGSRQRSGHDGKKDGGSVYSPMNWTEYDFNYMIKLYDSKPNEENKSSYAPKIIQELSAFVKK